MAKQEIMDPETGEVQTLEQYDPSEIGSTSTIAAEVNQQIATARRYPRKRDIEIARTIEGRATMDEETAEECMYSVPRGNKTIEGPSIRYAEIVQQAWGNNRVSGVVMDIDRENMRIKAEGIYLDLETNAATRIVITRRIASTDRRTGASRIFNDDMIQVAGSAAVSIARRNAILAGVPRAVWRNGYEKVRRVIMGDIKTLANRRASALTEFQRFGLTAAQVFALLNVKDENDITLEHLVTLRGTLTGLRSGEVTVEDLFRQQQPATISHELPKTATVTETLDKFAEEPGKKEEATQPAEDAKARVQAKTDAEAAAENKRAGEPRSTAETQRVFEGKPIPGATAEAKATRADARLAQIEAATEKGKEAKGKGTRRSAVPGEYRADKELADAWCKGWDGLV